MSTSYGRKLIELIEKDLKSQMSEDYRWTIKDEANRLGVNYAVLSKWLSQGEISRIDLDNLRALARVLGPEVLDALELVR